MLSSEESRIGSNARNDDTGKRIEKSFCFLCSTTPSDSAKQSRFSNLFLLRCFYVFMLQLLITYSINPIRCVFLYGNKPLYLHFSKYYLCSFRFFSTCRMCQIYIFMFYLFFLNSLPEKGRKLQDFRPHIRYFQVS